MGKKNRPSRDEVLQRRESADEVASYSPLVRFLTGGQPLRRQPDFVQVAVSNIVAIDDLLTNRGWILDTETLSESGVVWEWPDSTISYSDVSDEIVASLDAEHETTTYLLLGLFDENDQLISEPSELDYGLAGAGVMASDVHTVQLDDLQVRLPELEAHRAG